LKKLETWESASDLLKKEEIYELGLIYQYGVSEDPNESESDEVIIVEPNTHKATKYFKMITNKVIPGM
jgi:hypothetical protein